MSVMIEEVEQLLQLHNSSKIKAAKDKRSSRELRKALIYWVDENCTSVERASDICDPNMRKKDTITFIKWADGKKYKGKVLEISLNVSELEKMQAEYDKGIHGHSSASLEATTNADNKRLPVQVVSNTIKKKKKVDTLSKAYAKKKTSENIMNLEPAVVKKKSSILKEDQNTGGKINQISKPAEDSGCVVESVNTGLTKNQINFNGKELGSEINTQTTYLYDNSSLTPLFNDTIIGTPIQIEKQSSLIDGDSLSMANNQKASWNYSSTFVNTSHITDSNASINSGPSYKTQGTISTNLETRTANQFQSPSSQITNSMNRRVSFSNEIDNAAIWSSNAMDKSHGYTNVLDKEKVYTPISSYTTISTSPNCSDETLSTATCSEETVSSATCSDETVSTATCSNETVSTPICSNEVVATPDSSHAIEPTCSNKAVTSPVYKSSSVGRMQNTGFANNSTPSTSTTSTRMSTSKSFFDNEEKDMLLKRIDDLEKQLEAQSAISLMFSTAGPEVSQFLEKMLKMVLLKKDDGAEEPDISTNDEKVELVKGYGVFVTPKQRRTILYDSAGNGPKLIRRVLEEYFPPDQLGSYSAMGTGLVDSKAIPRKLMASIYALLDKYCPGHEMKPKEIHFHINRKCGVARSKNKNLSKK